MKGRGCLLNVLKRLVSSSPSKRKIFNSKPGKDGNFVDSICITVHAGKGGTGGVGFFRSATTARGRPCGGNGGKGGDVWFRWDPGKNSLNSTPPVVRAENGKRGGTKNMLGKAGSDHVIEIPSGTSIIPCEIDTTNQKKRFIPIPNEPALELNEKTVQFMAARGGRGGKGNYALGLNNHEVEEGRIGQSKYFILDLKTIADVGLVGTPNAGKSSFLCAVSNAHPKVAPYPFTTLNPFVGVVQFPDFSQFTIADIPGLIKGAHQNIGLGHAFLKHIVKSNFIGYVIDASLSEPWNDLNDLRYELEMFDSTLINKKSFIIANKIDKGEKVFENVQQLQTRFPDMKVFPISARYSLGVTLVTNYLRSIICPPLNVK